MVDLLKSKLDLRIVVGIVVAVFIGTFYVGEYIEGIEKPLDIRIHQVETFISNQDIINKSLDDKYSKLDDKFSDLLDLITNGKIVIVKGKE